MPSAGQILPGWALATARAPAPGPRKETALDAKDAGSQGDRCRCASACRAPPSGRCLLGAVALGAPPSSPSTDTRPKEPCGEQGLHSRARTSAFLTWLQGSGQGPPAPKSHKPPGLSVASAARTDRLPLPAPSPGRAQRGPFALSPSLIHQPSQRRPARDRQPHRPVRQERQPARWGGEAAAPPRPLDTRERRAGAGGGAAWIMARVSETGQHATLTASQLQL